MEPVSWWSTFGPPATSLTRRLLVYFRSGAYKFLLAVALEKSGDKVSAKAAYTALGDARPFTPFSASAKYRQRLLDLSANAPEALPSLYRTIDREPDADGWFLISGRWSWTTARGAVTYLLAEHQKGAGTDAVTKALNQLAALPPEAAQHADTLEKLEAGLGDIRANGLLNAARLERAGDIPGAIAAYQLTESQNTNSPYATSANFRKRVLQFPGRTPEALLPFYKAASQELDASGWFLVSGRWVWSSKGAVASKTLGALQRQISSGAMINSLNRLSTLAQVEAAKVVEELRGSGASKVGDERENGFLLAAAIEQAGDLKSAISAYREAGNKAPGTPYAVSAVFRLRYLELPSRTPDQLERFYKTVAAEPEAEGWFLISKKWDWSSTRRAAWQGLVNMRSDQLSFSLLSFLHARSTFSPVYAYLFVLFALAAGVKILELPLSIRAAAVAYRIERLRPQIAAIQGAYKDDVLKMNEALMQLYRRHGINVWGGWAVGLVDLVFVIWAIVALRDFAPQLALDGARLQWIPDVTRFDFRILVLWVLLSLVAAVITPAQQPGARKVAVIAILSYSAIICLIAWFWQWPAHVFIFWSMLAVLGVVVQIVVTPFRRVIAH